MPQVADYKIIHENGAVLTNIGDALTVNFDLSATALLSDNFQRPFITFNIESSGAMSQTIAMSLNGAPVNTHTYAIDAMLSTRTVIINGSTFNSGQNTLIFTLANGAGAGGWTTQIRDVIVHFQREV